jgi:hypothetical protein
MHQQAHYYYESIPTWMHIPRAISSYHSDQSICAFKRWLHLATCNDLYVIFQLNNVIWWGKKTNHICIQFDLLSNTNIIDINQICILWDAVWLCATYILTVEREKKLWNTATKLMIEFNNCFHLITSFCALLRSQWITYDDDRSNKVSKLRYILQFVLNLLPSTGCTTGRLGLNYFIFFMTAHY